MILKLIGGIIVIVSSGLIGIAASTKFANRPSELRKARVLFQMLETEVIYGATPLPVAFFNISTKTDGLWFLFFNKAKEKLTSGKYYSLTDAWNSSIDEVFINSNLHKMDLALFKNFSNVLGSSDRADQLKHFKLLYAQLEQHEGIAEEEKKKNQKMYSSLGFLFGSLVFIILI